MYFRYFVCLPLEKCIALLLNNLNLIPFTRGCFVFSLVEIGTVVLEKRIFKFRQFQYLRRIPSFENTWIPFTQGCIVPSLVEIGAVVLEEKILKHSSMYFRCFLIFYLGKGRGRLLVFEKENSLYPRMLCAKFGWNWPSTWFLRRRWKCEKFADTRTADNRRSEKLSWAFSSGELKKQHFYLGKIMSKTFR